MNCYKILKLDPDFFTEEEQMWLCYTFGLVYSNFEMDDKKTAKWFKFKNPLFGNISALELIKIGRSKLVYRTVVAATNGEFP